MDIFRRLTEDVVKLNLEILKDIEDSYHFKFPEKFKSFHQLFKSGMFYEIWPSYIGSDLRILPICSINYKKGDINFMYEELLSPLSIKRHYFNNPDAEWLLNKYRIVKIGSNVVGGGTYLGVNSDNAEKIYIIVWGQYNEPLEICDSIFDYYIGLDYVNYIENYQNYYKSLTDKYYRIDNEKFNINERYKEKIEKININEIKNSDLVKYEELLNELNIINDNYYNK